MLSLASGCLKDVAAPSVRPTWSLWRWVLLGAVMMASWPAHIIPAFAEEEAYSGSTRVDCRYEGIGERSSGNGNSSKAELFPENDVFRPLWADPKQPQFFAILAGDQGSSAAEELFQPWGRLGLAITSV